MSFLTNDPRRLTVGPFSQLPDIGALPATTRPSASVAGSVAGSGTSAVYYPIARDERCFITKSLSYTHERAHWISAVRRVEDRKADITRFIVDLGIVDEAFELDDASNLVNLDRAVHKSLDSYALIAVTGTSETLRQFSVLLKADNDERQNFLDESGFMKRRNFETLYSNPTFRNPKYELVVLHPEHFLPAESVLTLYDPARGTHKTYLPSPDRLLRESPGDILKPPFPPFSGPNRQPSRHLNALLVILNAQIKFRRYHRLPPPSQPLPEHVLNLMKQTDELVELIYWEPQAKPGSLAETLIKDRQEARRVNEDRHGRPNFAKLVESDEEFGYHSDGGGEGEATIRGPGRRRGRAVPWPEGADSQTRMEMGSALLSGHNLEFDSEDEDFVESLHSHGEEFLRRQDIAAH